MRTYVYLLRPMHALSDPFPTARAEILRLRFDDPAKMSHLRNLARLAGLTAAALQRELANLTKGGLLVSRRNGHRLYFRANTSHPLDPGLAEGLNVPGMVNITSW